MKQMCILSVFKRLYLEKTGAHIAFCTLNLNNFNRPILFVSPLINKARLEEN
jgi:hypothetical protein